MRYFTSNISKQFTCKQLAYVKEKNLLDSATGPVTIPMTNDYLFRALLQRNNNVLKGLLCSLLQMKEAIPLST